MIEHWVKIWVQVSVVRFQVSDDGRQKSDDRGPVFALRLHRGTQMTDVRGQKTEDPSSLYELPSTLFRLRFQLRPSRSSFRLRSPSFAETSRRGRQKTDVRCQTAEGYLLFVIGY